MHEYYAKNASKLKKSMNSYLKPITTELEQHSGKSYSVFFDEIWNHYEKNMLEFFPYIGGDKVSGTKNLTGAYFFVSGSFETKTMNPPEEGYGFSYHNLVCPLSAFAKAHGYEAYMPYLCNMDYVMFGALSVPLYREHTCFEDGDYCDFKLKIGAEPMEYWPPVFAQGKGYK